MRRDQLEHAIRTACQIIERPTVVVVGSQTIHGTFTEDQLPPEATMSVEVDILPIADDNDEPARLADLIEGVAGEWSPFTHLLESASIDRHVVAASTRLPQTTPVSARLFECGDGPTTRPQAAASGTPSPRSKRGGTTLHQVKPGRTTGC